MVLLCLVSVLAILVLMFFMIVGDSTVRRLPQVRAAAVVLAGAILVLGLLIIAAAPWKSWFG